MRLPLAYRMPATLTSRLQLLLCPAHATIICLRCATSSLRSCEPRRSRAASHMHSWWPKASNQLAAQRASCPQSLPSRKTQISQPLKEKPVPPYLIAHVFLHQWICVVSMTVPICSKQRHASTAVHRHTACDLLCMLPFALPKHSIAPSAIQPFELVPASRSSCKAYDLGFQIGGSAGFETPSFDYRVLPSLLRSRHPNLS